MRPGRQLRRGAIATPRRGILATVPGLFAAMPAAAGPAEEWRLFCDRFLTPDGRIVDTGNENVSHSEGQGWGLMFAAAFDDRPAFDRILAWTRRVLKRRTDNLHAWRFHPTATPSVADPNNATDGDLYIAFGLLMAHTRWRHGPYRDLAVAIGRDVLRLTLRHRGGHPVLLPGAGGFESAAGLVVNPSYLVLPAFAALERAMSDEAWRGLSRAGVALLSRARFGAWGLPPDWALLPNAANAPPRLATAWPPRFSFDAVRVPLLLAWAGETGHPALRGALTFWSDPRWSAPPAWVDLVTGQTAEFAASPGVRAIAAFGTARVGRGGSPLALPSVNASGDYYSASLTLLTRVACDATGVSVA